jgi:hypothetical protein
VIQARDMRPKKQIAVRFQWRGLADVESLDGPLTRPTMKPGNWTLRGKLGLARTTSRTLCCPSRRDGNDSTVQTGCSPFAHQFDIACGGHKTSKLTLVSCGGSSNPPSKQIRPHTAQRLCRLLKSVIPYHHWQDSSSEAGTLLVYTPCVVSPRAGLCPETSVRYLGQNAVNESPA